MEPTNNPTPTTPTPPTPPTPSPEPMVGPSPVDTGAPNPVGQPGVAAGMANPAVQSGGMPGQAPTQPAVGPSPVNPVVRPSVGVTDPIMMPEKPQAPDPIEEELKAPMKAAGPVPGSIGSAVSGPVDGAAGAAVSAENPFANVDAGKTPSVSFNDPATQADANTTNAQQPAAKKKANKVTLIALIAVAAVVVIVLIVILIMQLNSGGSSSNTASSNTNNSGSSSQTVPVDEPEEETEETPEAPEVASSVSCSTTTQSAAGETNVENISFDITNNQLAEIRSTTDITDANGVSVSNSVAIVSLEELISDDATRTKLVDEDGTLLVDGDVLLEELQTALNAGGTAVYTCENAS
ncbi:hypothetical protein IKE82_00475 [Candidatus Saccharibacteria bacterium]|nr:hypothetical protein [Candidatus Saccharibacteria bacterium]